MSSPARLFLSAAFCAACLLALPSDTAARPGGGHTFEDKGSSPPSGGASRPAGGGSRSDSPRSSGGSTRSSDDSWSERPPYSAPWTAPDPPPPDTRKRRSPHGSQRPPPQTIEGSLFEFFFYLFAVGIVVFGAVAIRILRFLGGEVAYAVGKVADRKSEPPVAPVLVVATRYDTVEAALEAIQAEDEDFSFIVFEDFLYALYAEVHTARGVQKLDLLEPYVADEARSGLASADLEAVRDIVVGGMLVEEVHVDREARKVRVKVRFTSNYTEVRAGAEQSYYADEVWWLSRSADVKSRPPEKARVVGCPNCGASLEKLVASKCKYCGQVTDDGDHDWRVDEIEVAEKITRGPMLTGTSEEVGTGEPTQVSEDAEQKFQQLVAWDPALDFRLLGARVELVFATFHRAWSAQDLTEVRPFLTDSLFDLQRYWVAAYKAQGLRNITEDPRIVTVHLSRVRMDKHFNAITMRVYATCRDYTVDQTENVVGGSRDQVRFYSEYWTLVRARGTKGAPRLDPGCPNCGAPAASINMAGTCRSCNAEITRGDFDWVLSRIEQDEVYRL